MKIEQNNSPVFQSFEANTKKIRDSKNISEITSDSKQKQPKNPTIDAGEIKLANNALAHLSMADTHIQRLNGEKMDEAMSGLRDITVSLKEILNRNLKAINANIPSNIYTYEKSEVQEKLASSANLSSLHDNEYLAQRAEALLA